MQLSTLFTPVAIALLSISELVSGHALFVDAWGDAGPGFHGYGLGYIQNTARNGGSLVPHQLDVPVFDARVVHNKWNANRTPYGCGISTSSHAVWVQRNNAARWAHIAKNKLGWEFLWEAGAPAGARIDTVWSVNNLGNSEGKSRYDIALKKTFKSGIPKVKANGKLYITAWQVNLDGAGPYSCQIDYRGQANSWTKPLKMIRNCPGDSLSRHWPGVLKPCTFIVQLPADLKCGAKYGKHSNICIVRCENKAENGPFGGCIPVQQQEPQKPKPKPVKTVKPVTVVRTKIVKPTVLPPKPVTVTKNAIITVIRGGKTAVSVVTKSSVVFITQVVQPPPQTTVEIEYKTSTVTVEEPALSTEEETNPEIYTVAAPEPGDKKLTPEEIEKAIGGEEYDPKELEDLKNDAYYKQKLRFRRE
ncbi:uncharacterized protein DFL_005777 [Arthrobotrys flagrans]|uniref:Chitin-binding type-4 domain-containing protein n=1 Tax=Arthrobotrys flagrans TaxID=97331 RepID=A0A436ZYI4_ARTFL|nr:hypothetical protein DFL_005777 [Arthrobotrys flagrans]